MKIWNVLFIGFCSLEAQKKPFLRKIIFSYLYQNKWVDKVISGSLEGFWSRPLEPETLTPPFCFDQLLQWCSKNVTYKSVPVPFSIFCFIAHLCIAVFRNMQNVRVLREAYEECESLKNCNSQLECHSGMSLF